MNDQIQQLGTWGHDLKIAVLGILYSAAAMVGANYPVDILQYHLIVIGPVFITLQALFTILSAIAGLTLAVFSVIKIIHHLKSEVRRQDKTG